MLAGFDRTLLPGGDKEFAQRGSFLDSKLRYSLGCVVRIPTRPEASEIEAKTWRTVDNDHRSATGSRHLAAKLFSFVSLGRGNSQRLNWACHELGNAEWQFASEVVLKFIGCQVPEWSRFLSGKEARRLPSGLGLCMY